MLKDKCKKEWSALIESGEVTLTPTLTRTLTLTLILTLTLLLTLTLTLTLPPTLTLAPTRLTRAQVLAFVGAGLHWLALAAAQARDT